MSDKFKVIDHSTYERMQQSNSSGSATTFTQKIRNAKYKRMTATDDFNLLEFIKIKDRGGKKCKIRKRIVDTNIYLKIKKHGKQRENGRKKKIGRLKKSILRYRLLKRIQQKQDEQLEYATNQLNNLALNETTQTTIVNNKGDLKNKNSGLHSRRFRDYCDNCTTDELKQYCEQLLRELNHFQRRAYALNEIKARAHRRFVVGFRETQNYLRINKVKLVIIATDCERSEGEVSLEQTIEDIKISCHDQQIPVAYAFQRRQLAFILYKKASISCIGILDYDGARAVTIREVVTGCSLIYKNRKF